MVRHRPLFPVLLKMSDMLDPEQKLAVKREWKATLRQFLEPLCKLDNQLNQDEEPAFHCYILSKR